VRSGISGCRVKLKQISIYDITLCQLRYILDEKDVYRSHFPGETFRVLKEKEEKQYVEYRTRRLV